MPVRFLSSVVLRPMAEMRAALNLHSTETGDERRTPCTGNLT